MSSTAGQNPNSKRHLSLPLACDNNIVGSNAVAYIGRVLREPLPIGPVEASSLTIAGPITQTEGAFTTTASVLDDGAGNARLGGNLSAVSGTFSGGLSVQGSQVQLQGQAINAGANVIQTSGTVIAGTVQSTNGTFSFATVGGLNVQQQGTAVDSGANPIQTTCTVSAGAFIGGSGAFVGELTLNALPVQLQGAAVDAGANTIQTTGTVDAGQVSSTAGAFSSTLTVGGINVQKQGDPINAGPNTIQNTGVASLGFTNVNTLSAGTAQVTGTFTVFGQGVSYQNVANSTNVQLINTGSTTNVVLTLPNASGQLALAGSAVDTTGTLFAGGLVVGTGVFTGALIVQGSGISSSSINTQSLVNEGTGAFVGTLYAAGGLTGSVGTFNQLNAQNANLINMSGTSLNVLGTATFGGVLTGSSGSFSQLYAANASLTSLSGTSLTYTSIVSGTGAFSGQLLASGGVSGSFGAFNQLYAPSASLTNLSGTNTSWTTIVSGTGIFTQLASTGASISSISGTALNYGTGTFSVLSAVGSSLTAVSGTSLGFATGVFVNLSSTQLTSTAGSISSVTGSSLAYTTLTAGTGTITNLTSTSGTFATLNANAILLNGVPVSTAAASSNTGTFITLFAGTGAFISLFAGTGTFTSGLQAQSISTTGAASSATLTLAQGLIAQGVAPSPIAGAASVQVGVNSSAQSYIQALSSTGSAAPLLVNNAGGSVSTSKVLIDDGGGNMSINSSTNSTPLLVNTSFGSGVQVALAQSGTNRVFLGWNNVNGIYVNDAASGKAVLYQGSTTMPSLHSYLSTLDDGSGNLTLGGTLFLGGTGIFSSSSQGTTIEPVFGNVKFKAGAAGTAASWQVQGATGSVLLSVYNAGIVQTSHSSLDDGAGNLTVGGTGTINGALVVNGLNASFQNLTGLNSGTSTVSIGRSGGGSANLVMVDNQSGSTSTLEVAPNLTASQTLTMPNASGVLVVNGSGQTSLSTSHSTLDDGSGDATFSSSATGTNFGNFNLQAPNLAVGSAYAYTFGVNSGVAYNAAQTYFNYVGSGSTANNVQMGFVSKSNILNYSATGKVSTGNSTIDDGTGNMAISGYIKAGTSGGVSSAYLATYSPSGVATAFVQGYAGAGTSTPIPLQLNPIGSSVSTQHSVLDDGNGNTYIAQTLYVGPITTNGQYLTMTSNQTTPGSSLQATQQGVAHNTLTLNPQGGSVKTASNTLDDGSGNMAVLGNLTITGAGTFGSVSAITLSAPTGAFTQLNATSGNITSLSGTTSTHTSVVGGTGSFTNLLTGTGAFISIRSASGSFTNLIGGTGMFVGPLSTTNSVLDDGVGNANLGGFLSVSPTVAGISKLSLYGSIANATGFYYGLGAYNSQLQYNSQANHGWFTQTTSTSTQTSLMVLSATGALVMKSGTILDNGSGNTTTSGFVAAGSFMQANSGYVQSSVASGYNNPHFQFGNVALSSFFPTHGGMYYDNNSAIGLASNDGCYTYSLLSSVKRVMIDDGQGNTTIPGTLIAANGASGVLTLTSASSAGSFFSNAAAGDSIIHSGTTSGSVRIGLGSGTAQLSISSGGVSIPSLTLSSLSNGTTSYVIPTNSDPRSLRLAAEPNYLVISGPTGVSISGGSLLFTATGPAGTIYSSGCTVSGTTVVLPVAGVYSVLVQLAGPVSATSNASLTMSCSNGYLGGQTAYVYNSQGSSAPCSLSLNAWVNSLGSNATLSFAVVNMTSLTSGSVHVEQTMNQ